MADRVRPREGVIWRSGDAGCAALNGDRDGKAYCLVSTCRTRFTIPGRASHNTHIFGLGSVLAFSAGVMLFLYRSFHGLHAGFASKGAGSSPRSDILPVPLPTVALRSTLPPCVSSSTSSSSCAPNSVMFSWREDPLRPNPCAGSIAPAVVRREPARECFAAAKRRESRRVKVRHRLRRRKRSGRAGCRRGPPGSAAVQRQAGGKSGKHGASDRSTSPRQMLPFIASPSSLEKPSSPPSSGRRRREPGRAIFCEVACLRADPSGCPGPLGVGAEARQAVPLRTAG